jgi:hypothetical protein
MSRGAGSLPLVPETVVVVDSVFSGSRSITLEEGEVRGCRSFLGSVPDVK